MKRNEWTFAYSAAQLGIAAQEKKSHHEERLKVWAAKKEEVMALIRKEGLEIDESVMTDAVAKFSKHSSSYREPSVTIRNDLMDDLNETLEKTREHQKKVKEYDGWLQAMSAQANKIPMPTFDLNHDDWMFFFGT